MCFEKDVIRRDICEQMRDQTTHQNVKEYFEKVRSEMDYEICHVRI